MSHWTHEFYDMRTRQFTVHLSVVVRSDQSGNGQPEDVLCLNHCTLWSHINGWSQPNWNKVVQIKTYFPDTNLVPTRVQHLYQHVYNTCTNTCTTFVPTLIQHLYQHVYNNCTNTCTTLVPTRVQHLYQHAYNTCTNLFTARACRLSPLWKEIT